MPSFGDDLDNHNIYGDSAEDFHPLDEQPFADPDLDHLDGEDLGQQAIFSAAWKRLRAVGRALKSGSEDEQIHLGAGDEITAMYKRWETPMDTLDEIWSALELMITNSSISDDFRFKLRGRDVTTPLSLPGDPKKEDGVIRVASVSGQDLEDIIAEATDNGANPLTLPSDPQRFTYRSIDFELVPSKNEAPRASENSFTHPTLRIHVTLTNGRHLYIHVEAQILKREREYPKDKVGRASAEEIRRFEMPAIWVQPTNGFFTDMGSRVREGHTFFDLSRGQWVGIRADDIKKYASRLEKEARALHTEITDERGRVVSELGRYHMLAKDLGILFPRGGAGGASL